MLRSCFQPHPEKSDAALRAHYKLAQVNALRLSKQAAANSTMWVSTMPVLSGDINPHDRRAPDFNVNRLRSSWSVQRSGAEKYCGLNFSVFAFEHCKSK